MKILPPGIKLGVLPDCLLQRCENPAQAPSRLLSVCAFYLRVDCPPAVDGSRAFRVGPVLWEKETGAHYPALLRLGCGHLLHPDVGQGLLKSRG